jgi:hypothetical protein
MYAYRTCVPYKVCACSVYGQYFLFAFYSLFFLFILLCNQYTVSRDCLPTSVCMNRPIVCILDLHCITSLIKPVLYAMWVSAAVNLV